MSEVVISNGDAVAALRSDGSVITWGWDGGGGDSSAVASQLASGVVKIVPSLYSFAALKTDGSVVTWGTSPFGAGDSSLVSDQLAGGVVDIVAAADGYAVLKADGSVITWGNEAGEPYVLASFQIVGDVVDFISAGSSFAALKSDGSVVTWGIGELVNSSQANQLSSDVIQIISSEHGGFAALKTDGSVVSSDESTTAITDQLTGDVIDVVVSAGGFAALKTDGSVVTWGQRSAYSDPRSDTVAAQLDSDVIEIIATNGALAALKSDGSVVSWGDPVYGGDSSSVSEQLTSDVVKVFNNFAAFAALKSDGSVVTWGEENYGWVSDGNLGGDSSAVSDQLTSGVNTIVGDDYAFAALKDDGSVVTWGSEWSGGKSTAVAADLASDVFEVISLGRSFAALKTDGSLITWGNQAVGGDSSLVSSYLGAGSISIARSPEFSKSLDIFSVPEGVDISNTNFTFFATDPNSDTVHYSLSGIDAGFLNIDSSTGLVGLNESPDYETKNQYLFNVDASDGSLTDSISAILNVTNVNEAPVFNSSTATASVAEYFDVSRVIYTAAASDGDSDSLTYSLSGTDGPWLTIGSTSGEVTFNTSPDYETKDEYLFRIIATDAGGLTDGLDVTIDITDLNEAPEITSSVVTSVTQDSSYTYTLVHGDVDAGDTLTLSNLTLPSWLKFDTTTGVLSGTPINDDVGTHDVTLTVTDVAGLSDSQSFAITVANLNDPPIFGSATASVSIDENKDTPTVVYTAVASDIDAGDTLSYSLGGTDGSLLTIDSTTGEVRLKASPDYETKDQYLFTVTASDGSLTDVIDVTLEVTDVVEIVYHDTGLIEGSSADDDIDATANQPNWIQAGDGADVINLVPDGIWSYGYYALHASSDNGTSTGRLVSLNGMNQYSDVIDGGADADTINLTDGSDAFFLDDVYSDIHLDVTDLQLGQNITLNAKPRILDLETINAGEGDDLIDLTAVYSQMLRMGVSVNGEAGNDILWGGLFADTLNGGSGDDVINGNMGNDVLTGGEGADTFEFMANAGRDTIRDFSLIDKLVFYYREGEAEESAVASINNGIITWDAVTIDLGDPSLALNDLNITYEMI